MRSHVSRADGVASVKRAYAPEEIRTILSDGIESRRRIDISRHYLFRMGVIAWKSEPKTMESRKPSGAKAQDL
jgi:hypothetical protein